MKKIEKRKRKKKGTYSNKDAYYCVGGQSSKLNDFLFFAQKTNKQANSNS